MTDLDGVKLAPCPFCGGEAAVFKTTSTLSPEIEPERYVVSCEQLACCEGGRPHRTEAAAISFWNERAALVSPPKAGEGEPVAWRWKAHGHEAGPWIVVHDKGTAEAAMSLFASKGKHQSVQPLYATQQPRVDGVRVTDEMVARVTAAVKRYTQATLFVDELREIVRSALVSHAPAIGETQPGLSATDETRAGSLEQGETAP